MIHPRLSSGNTADSQLRPIQEALRLAFEKLAVVRFGDADGCGVEQ